MDDFYQETLESLLRERVLDREMRVLVVCGDLPDSYLRFHPEKLKFTGRYDDPR